MVVCVETHTHIHINLHCAHVKNRWVVEALLNPENMSAAENAQCHFFRPVEGVAAAAVVAKHSVDELPRMLGLLKMRMALIEAQKATTQVQITATEDAIRAEHARRRVQAGAPQPQLQPRTQHLRSVPSTSRRGVESASPAPRQLTGVVRRRSKRAFNKRILAKRAGAAAAKIRSGGAKCAICLCRMDDSAACTSTPCNHTFHNGCIDQWAASNYASPTCPVCRELLFVPE